MPRILPRLLRAWEQVRGTALDKPAPAVPKRRPQRVSGRRFPAKRALEASDDRSLLLDPKNVVQNKQHYVYRKSPSPKVFVSRRDLAREAHESKPRAMTKEEREWYANPYLRMLVSPMRRDLMSGRVLPRDFLLRFTILNIPGSRASTFSSLMVAPDLIEHRRYKSQAGRVGHYIECNKAVIEMSEQRQYWRKIPSKNAQFNIPYFQARTGHLLRLRVLQELELLAQHLQPRPRAAGESPVMRRLTRAEFNNIKETGVIPFEKAIAVIVVPPVNMNPKTKQRPIPADSSLPPQEDDRPIPEKPLPPLCTLLPTVKDDPLVDVPTTPQYLPPAKVPLYHGLAAFPSRAQRAALHKALNRILSIERTARWREHGRPEGTVEGEEGRKQEDPWARGDKKGSHAYIIFSSADTVLRADTVPLAIALWRLRLWEGDGWDNKSKNTSAGGWKIILPKRLPS